MMTSQRIWIVLSLLTSLSQAFSLRDQGYFDLGVGPTLINENIYGNDAPIEYSPGAKITTSVGMSYKNGLGLGINYAFTFNNKRNSDQLENNQAREIMTSTFMLDFKYKIMPASDVSLVLHAGPGLLIGSNQTLQKSSVPADESSEATQSQTVTQNFDANGVLEGSQVVTTASATQEADAGQVNPTEEFQAFDNLAFAYEVGGSLEYREDKHKAFAIRVNYLLSELYKSTFDEQDVDKVVKEESDQFENLSTSLVLRYYL